MKNHLFLIMLGFLILSTLACLQINFSLNGNPTATFSPTHTVISQPSATPDIPPLSPSVNMWCLTWSPNYCLRYDAALWELRIDAQGYGELVNLIAPDCRITEQGPMGLPDDISRTIIGSIEYTTVDRLYTTPSFMGFTALSNPDPDTQNCPHFFVYITMPDHFECQPMARKVLSTLELQ